MQLFLVRHAHAGQRSHDGRDIYRPLSAVGQDRAAELVDGFAGRQIDRILSSPATRCLQTLGPLGLARGVEVEECQALWEGSSITEAIDALQATAGDGVDQVVACSHGDIIPAVIETLAGAGVPIVGRGCELGSIWALDLDDGHWREARYLGTGANALA